MKALSGGEIPDSLSDVIDGFVDQEFDPEYMIFNKKYLEPTILLTYNCNFDCPYCFQKDYRRKDVVQDKVIRGFINYIKRNSKGRKVRVSYFGGEPLLQLKKIEDISKEIDSSGLDYSFSVITNGSLLSPSVLDKLVSLGLTHVQITLDGPREVHDKRRFFVGGKGSFDLILDHLAYAQDKTNVVLRINVDYRNVDEIRELLSTLKERGIIRVRIDPHLVHENIFRNEYWDNLIAKENEGDILAKVWEIAREEGFQVPHEAFRLGICVAHVEDDIVVDPYGNVYPCWAFTGNPLYVKGTLNEDGTVKLNGKFSSKVAREVWKGKCDNCPFLPMCMGGCRFFSVLNRKGFDGVDCQKRSYEEIVKLIRYFV
ncbi:radical SAM protein [Sulfolobus metallicus DSM 6482 = JCM 9184]|uniref:Radical SAM protein n=2 Tax=Sulfuracidifex metallicus TaxID=47303 RepID=A0A6A9QMA4_SULME|nr:radical SAM protein [Sulfuracidifex metallicus]MUN29664.1 radical SAM protein [Sulfuracidifex metallicus DSM 6482 = JCM 9184]